MRATRVAAVFLCWAAGMATPQQDWAKLFERLTSHDRAISDPARTEIATDVLPKLCEGRPEFVTAQIPGLVAQLNRSDKDGARKGAVAFLMVIAEYRADSATVLSSALSALIRHAQDDSLEEVRRNSVQALASLNPEIPERAIEELLTIIESPDQQSTMPVAFYGVARLAGTRPEAAVALDSALSDSPARKTAAIKAIGAADVTDPHLDSRLGSLLADKDEGVVRAALEAIGKLGIPAIALNSARIGRLAETSSNKEFAALAHQLLERQTAGQ